MQFQWLIYLTFLGLPIARADFPGVTHIGIVANPKKQIVHNIGAGDVLEDVLFAWKIQGHFRYGRHSKRAGI